MRQAKSIDQLFFGVALLTSLHEVDTGYHMSEDVYIIISNKTSTVQVPASFFYGQCK